MDQTTILNSMADIITGGLTSCFESDILLVLMSLLGIEVILIGFGLVYRSLSMDEFEKKARKKHKAYMNNRNSWNAPLHRKAWLDSVDEYKEHHMDDDERLSRVYGYR